MLYRGRQDPARALRLLRFIPTRQTNTGTSCRPSWSRHTQQGYAFIAFDLVRAGSRGPHHGRRRQECSKTAMNYCSNLLKTQYHLVTTCDTSQRVWARSTFNRTAVPARLEDALNRSDRQQGSSVMPPARSPERRRLSDGAPLSGSYLGPRHTWRNKAVCRCAVCSLFEASRFRLAQHRTELKCAAAAAGDRSPIRARACCCRSGKHGRGAPLASAGGSAPQSRLSIDA